MLQFIFYMLYWKFSFLLFPIWLLTYNVSDGGSSKFSGHLSDPANPPHHLILIALFMSFLHGLPIHSSLPICLWPLSPPSLMQLNATFPRWQLTGQASKSMGDSSAYKEQAGGGKVGGGSSSWPHYKTLALAIVTPQCMMMSDWWSQA